MKKTAVVIENVHPFLDCGRYAIKRLVGDPVHVTADIFKDGHDVVAAALKWRMVGTKKWQEVPMTPGNNDVWSGSFAVTEIHLMDVAPPTCGLNPGFEPVSCVAMRFAKKHASIRRKMAAHARL